MFCLLGVLAFALAAKELQNHQWRFVPHPHRSWAQKFLPWTCTWRTVFDVNGTDAITSALLREGHCSHDVDSFPVHLLSTSQARACVANRTILLSGDSYTKQLFVGLADILAGVANTTEIHNSAERDQALAHASAQMGQIGLNVRFVCSGPNKCYGGGVSLSLCSQCSSALPADVRAIGTTVHLLAQGLAATEASIAAVSQSVQNLLWISGPAYNQQLIPFPYNGTMPLGDTQRVYADTLGPSGLLLQAHKSVSFLDVMSMTRACYAQWKNCSADGGHNSRFVERMKATLLLNILCEPAL